MQWILNVRHRLLAGSVGFLAGALSTSVAEAIELTVDASIYAYRETNDQEEFFMSDDSESFFYSLGIRDWDRPEQNGDFGYMYTAEGTYGRVNYNSKGSGSTDKEYVKGRGEVFASYRGNDYLTGLLGLGYRRLLDNSGGNYGQKISKGKFYDRRSQYFYVPFGVRIDPFEKFYVKLQYNLFIKGLQTSFLKSTNQYYSDVTNEQNAGTGFDIAGNYELFPNWSAYGFYRYWDVEKSEIVDGTVPVYGFVSWWEPDNTTTEMGLGIAYKF